MQRIKPPRPAWPPHSQHRADLGPGSASRGAPPPPGAATGSFRGRFGCLSAGDAAGEPAAWPHSARAACRFSSDTRSSSVLCAAAHSHSARPAPVCISANAKCARAERRTMLRAGDARGVAGTAHYGEEWHGATHFTLSIVSLRLEQRRVSHVVLPKPLAEMQLLLRQVNAREHGVHKAARIQQARAFTATASSARTTCCACSGTRSSCARGAFGLRWLPASA